MIAEIEADIYGLQVCIRYLLRIVNKYILEYIQLQKIVAWNDPILDEKRIKVYRLGQF